ncbi:transmembrane emp24 domain-containing protein 7-like [Sitodiplosis mosellana]|uniref:transmembrane emp24 domain-containing protein 7-like n=1 Tax=Sitodiplosis mosellana TaxID=263140 RepID=UPI0024450726|nr:transmembrane emp24 domain-containing protein 7-like [Sitodiplosis mosellana]
MRNSAKFVHFLCSIIGLSHVVFGTEFTFDLAANGEECFFENINQNSKCQFEFQVVSGGQLDVDVIIESPMKQIIYKAERKELDRFNFNTSETGVHRICFNNQFSTFTEKSIFILFETGRTNQLLQLLEEHDHEMTFMESRADQIHDYLENIINLQTYYRLREGYGRRFAKELNDRVLWWSVTQTFVILIIGITQVLVLRKLFEKDPSSNKSKITLAHQIEVFG